MFGMQEFYSLKKKIENYENLICSTDLIPTSAHCNRKADMAKNDK
jgi:hypothetical protein